LKVAKLLKLAKLLKVAKAGSPNVALRQCYDGEMEAALGIAVNGRSIRLSGARHPSVLSRQQLPKRARSGGNKIPVGIQGQGP
jgi:hypothetical protein